MCCSGFEVVNLAYPWKAGSWNRLRSLFCFCSWLDRSLSQPLGIYKESLSAVRPAIERSLADSYLLNFQSRVIEARTLNANVGYALSRAKRSWMRCGKILAILATPRQHYSRCHNGSIPRRRRAIVHFGPSASSSFHERIAKRDLRAA